MSKTTEAVGAGDFSPGRHLVNFEASEAVPGFVAGRTMRFTETYTADDCCSSARRVVWRTEKDVAVLRPREWAEEAGYR